MSNDFLIEAIIIPVLFALSTNLDNFAIGVTYGVKRIKFTSIAQLVIALLSGVSTFIAMSIGDWLEAWLPPFLSRELGNFILMGIGISIIFEIIKRKIQGSDCAAPAGQEPASDRQGVIAFAQNQQVQSLQFGAIGRGDGEEEKIRLWEAVLVGLALTISNFGTGIGAGIEDWNLLWLSGLSFVSSGLMIWSGAAIALFVVTKVTRQRLEWIAGFSLIGLGVYEYVMP